MFLKILFLLILGSSSSYALQFNNYVPGVQKPNNPKVEKLTVNKEHEIVIIQRLHHLNMLIFKDVIVKLRLAEKLQEKYKGTPAYELGIITAGILDHFKEMLKIYYAHTNITEWSTKHYSTNQLHDAYHVIHSRYMQILLEKDTYDKIVLENMKKQQALKEQYEKALADKLKKKQQKKSKKFSTVKPNLRTGDADQGPSDEAYKRRMRMRKWAEKWNNYDPKREGVDIDHINLDEVRDMMKKENIEHNRPM